MPPKNLLDPSHNHLCRRHNRPICPPLRRRIQPRHRLHRLNRIHFIDLVLREASADEDGFRDSRVRVIEVGAQTGGGDGDFAFDEGWELGSSYWGVVDYVDDC